MDKETQHINGQRDLIKKHLFIKDLKPKDAFQTSFMVKSKDLFLNKLGKPYLALLLGDNTGNVEGRVWEEAEKIFPTFEEGDIVAVGGKAHLFQERLQVSIENIAPIPKEMALVEDYLPQSAKNIEGMYLELLNHFEKVKDPFIKNLSLSLLKDPEISTRYKMCPAAKTIHHAYIGGLLFHSLQLIKLVDAVLPCYENLNRDLLIFGAAFHDFGKIYELSYHHQFGYTDEGKLVGHIAIGVSILDRFIQKIPDFPNTLEWQLKHLILSHHGKLEHGSPKTPCTLEAELLHNLDHMDSRMDSIQALMKSENNASRWSPFHKAYDQYYYKPDCYLKLPQ